MHDLAENKPDHPASPWSKGEQHTRENQSRQHPQKKIKVIQIENRSESVHLTHLFEKVSDKYSTENNGNDGKNAYNASVQKIKLSSDLSKLLCIQRNNLKSNFFSSIFDP